jgi:hypothetical protein
MDHLSLSALGGGMAPNGGLGGHMASPVTVNAPGGVNAQRGYQNTPMSMNGVNYNPVTSARPGPNFHPNFLQWIAQNRAGS